MIGLGLPLLDCLLRLEVVVVEEEDAATWIES